MTTSKKLADRLFEDPVLFTHAYFIEMGWDQYKPVSDLEEDALRFAAGIGVPSNQWWRIIKGYRLQGKTRVITISLALWRIYRDAERRIVIPSQSAEHAWKIIATIRQSIKQVSFLSHLNPSNDQRDRRDAFDVRGASVNPQPSFFAMGIDGQLQGQRAHSIFPDDIESEGNSLNIQARDNLETRCDNFSTWLYKNREEGQVGSRLALDPSEIVMVGTSKHDDDSLYERLGRRSVVIIRSYPIVYPRPGDALRTLAPILQKRLDADPSLSDRSTSSRWTDAEAHEKMNAVLPSTAAREYRLLVGSRSGSTYAMRLDDLILATWHIDRDKAPRRVVWGETDHNGSDTSVDNIPIIAPNSQRIRRPIMIDPTWLPYNSTKAFVDPSGSGEDRTGLAIVGELAGTFYVKCLVGLPGGGADCEKIAHLCRLWGATELTFEKNADTTSTWRQFMESALNKYRVEPGDSTYPDGWSCTLTCRHHQVQKELRIIQTLRPILNNHRLVVSRDILTPHEQSVEREFQYQLTRITEQRKSLKEDGILDALAGCIASWTMDGTPLVPSQFGAAMNSTARRVDSLMKSRDALRGKKNTHWMLKKWE